ncbi:MAG: tyrosine-type recombinase/integrase family protein [Selenomonadaceae bacterium]|nr:tyrosine-type recombinase/integrase family protein [Selenomonadaceae bacterium]
MSAWLENVVSTNVKPSSMQAYQSHFNNQIAPHLGEVKVQDLTPALLDEWMRKLLQSGLSWSDVDFAAKRITVRRSTETSSDIF